MLSIKTTHKKNPCAGFTLIEMAIVIILLGVSIAAFAPLYKAYLQNKSIQTTQNNIDNIAAAIGNFRAVNGRYPCPASLISVRGNVNYGREDCTDHGPASGAPIPVGTCDLAVSGLCMEQSERAINYINPFTFVPVVAGNPPIRVGAIPFKELNLDENEGYDGYNNRIMYAVTEHLSEDTTFRANEGGIEIVDNAAVPVSMLTPLASAHFLVFSHGKNGQGAFTRAGARLPCPVAGVEFENCNVAINSRYSQTQDDDTVGVTEFDDSMTYFTQSETPLWQLSTNMQGAIVQKPGGDVGMNFGLPSNNFAFAGPATQAGQTDGFLRANDDPLMAGVQGNIMASQLCDSGGIAGGNCFTPDLIAGAGMSCPADDPDGIGQFMVGVANGQPICENDTTMQCPSGSIMTGIDPNGRMICSGNTSCPTGTVNLCGNNHTLAAGPATTVRTIVDGLTAQQQYTCANSTWVLTSDIGVCTCAPLPDETQTNTPCGTGFAGSFDQTRSWICPTAASPRGTMPYWTAWTPPACDPLAGTCTYVPAVPCTCVGGIDTQNTSCPAGFTPNPPTQTRTFTCTGPQSGTWGPWVPPAFTCDCLPQPDQTQWVSCGGNSPPAAQKSQKLSFTCPPGVWDAAWTDVDTSACTCTPWTEIRTNDPCPIAGHVGSVTNQYDFTCPSGVTVTELDSNCAPPLPITCVWKEGSLVGTQATAAGQRVSDPCMTCGATSPQCHTGSPGNFQIYNTCICGP